MVRLWFSIIKYLRAIAAVFKVHDQSTNKKVHTAVNTGHWLGSHQLEKVIMVEMEELWRAFNILSKN